MNDWPYHQYLFFELKPSFYQLSDANRDQVLLCLREVLSSLRDVQVVPYATLGFKPGTTFMIWARAHQPEHIQTALRNLLHTSAGAHLKLAHSLFGIIRPSQYSRHPQKSDQVILAGERLPYLIIYPFTKTPAWHLLEFEDRRRLMGTHVKVGIGHPKIRQCLLYAYGVDDHEFIVSYETPTLEAFQDLVMELRTNAVRAYTQNDLPIYTCIYKSPEDLLAWL